MNKIGYYFDYDGAIEHMDAICDWLRANDVVPGRVPVTAKLVFSHGYMTVEAYELNANGRKFLDGTGNAAMTTLTVPVKVEPPEDVMAALRPLNSAEPTSGGYVTTDPNLCGAEIDQEPEPCGLPAGHEGECASPNLIGWMEALDVRPVTPTPAEPRERVDHADMRIEVVKRELNQGALAGFDSSVTAYAAQLVVAALDSYDAAALKAEYERGVQHGKVVQTIFGNSVENLQAEYERGKAEGIAERERAVADALLEVDHHLGALAYIDRGGIPYVEREWAFDVVNKAAKQVFGEGWPAILAAAVDRRRAQSGGSDAA